LIEKKSIDKGKWQPNKQTWSFVAHCSHNQVCEVSVVAQLKGSFEAGIRNSILYTADLRSFFKATTMYRPLNSESPPGESPPKTTAAAWGVERAEARRNAASNRARRNIKVKVVDLYNFNLEVSREDAVTINQVLERVKEQGRVWWAMEAKNGAGWYLQPEISSQADTTNRVSSLSLSTITGSMQLKKLIRKGIPPSLRPRVWMAVSGATKKQSTVPESYYQDLTQAVNGRETPATRQIDHDLGRTFPMHPWIDSADGRAALRRLLVAYSFRDSRVGYCQVSPTLHTHTQHHALSLTLEIPIAK
jgi:hypothetical protein